MAPIRPQPRHTHTSATTTAIASPKPSLSTSSAPLSTHTEVPDSYRVPHKQNKAPTKSTKRASKHASLLSRLHQTSGSSSRITKKRRRPSKKLVTNLKGLEEALPDDASLTRSRTGSRRQVGEGAGISREKGGAIVDSGVEVKKIQHKSLKSRPGAGKRKEKLMEVERERFAKNMAVMARASETVGSRGKSRIGKGADGDEQSPEGQGGGSRQRWAAIRNFIEQNMERTDPANS